MTQALTLLMFPVTESKAMAKNMVLIIKMTKSAFMTKMSYTVIQIIIHMVITECFFTITNSTLKQINMETSLSLVYHRFPKYCLNQKSQYGLTLTTRVSNLMIKLTQFRLEVYKRHSFMHHQRLSISQKKICKKMVHFLKSGQD